MRTLAHKSLTNEVVRKRHQRPWPSPVMQTSDPRRSSPAVQTLQRQTACPCDGGCPRCKETIQTKLVIGEPDDKYEQEADRVADQVMRIPGPALQPKPT